MRLYTNFPWCDWIFRRAFVWNRILNSQISSYFRSMCDETSLIWPTQVYHMSNHISYIWCHSLPLECSGLSCLSKFFFFSSGVSSRLTHEACPECTWISAPLRSHCFSFVPSGLVWFPQEYTVLCGSRNHVFKLVYIPQIIAWFWTLRKDPMNFHINHHCFPTCYLIWVTAAP